VRPSFHDLHGGHRATEVRGAAHQPGRPPACPQALPEGAAEARRSLRASWICRIRRVRCASRTVGSSPRLAWPSRSA